VKLEVQNQQSIGRIREQEEESTMYGLQNAQQKCEKILS